MWRLVFLVLCQIGIIQTIYAFEQGDYDLLINNNIKLFKKLDLSRAVIQNIEFRNVIFHEINFYRANLVNVDFIDCTFYKVDFDGAILENVCFDNLFCWFSSFFLTTIKNSKLRGRFETVDFNNASFTDVQAQDTRWSRVTFQYAFFDMINFEDAIFDNVDIFRAKIGYGSFRRAIFRNSYGCFFNKKNKIVLGYTKKDDLRVYNCKKDQSVNLLVGPAW